jgi:hypothetical protein
VPLGLPRPAAAAVLGRWRRPLIKLVRGASRTYLYAAHDGAHMPTCAAHSGVCHEECWNSRHYGDLYCRIATKEAPS